MTILNQNLFIAKGAERECYINPQDKSKIVKIQYCNNINRNQNNLDIYYYNYLKTKNISYKHISKYYQEIQTNLGQGIVFESILDYNDIYSKSFEDIIRERRLTNTKEESLLDTLKKYLQENMIVFGDVVLSNILCQEIQPNEFQLIIIDGLGSRRFGWKLWLHIHSTLFTKYRIHKQWKKLMINYRLLKSTT